MRDSVGQPRCPATRPAVRRVAAAVAVIVAGLSAGSAVRASASSVPTKPNVLFVLTDDMRLDDLQFMPNVRNLIAGQGMSFENEFDNVTLCCPARTSILRGQYSLSLIHI